MTNRVLIKRSGNPNAVPAQGDLEYGELAINYNDGNLFFKNSSNSITTLASTQFVSVSGNITGNYILANGSQLSGINSFSTLQVDGQSNVVASGLESVLIFDGDGIAITTDPANNTVLFSASGAAIRSALYGVGGSLGTLTDPLVSSGDAGLITDSATAIQDLGIITEAAAVEFAIDTAGNINAGNVVVASSIVTNTVVASGNVDATGNVSGNYLLGNIFFASGYSASKIYNGTTEANIGLANGNLEITVAGTPNILVVSSSGANITGYTTATGNVTGGNIVTAGIIAATGNITGGNLAVTGIVSGTTVTASGNITAGNANILGSAIVQGNLSVDAAVSITGNLTSVSNATFSGNVTSNYILANGSQLTGINGFSTIAVASQANVVAESIADTLTFVAGVGMSIGTDAATDTITFTSTPEIWTVGGSMGLVTQGATVFYDFSTVDDAVTIAYDLGGLVVSGIVTTDSIVDGAVTASKLASDINIETSGNVVAAVIRTVPVLVSVLPLAATVGVGARAFVTDADAMTWGTPVQGGGSNSVPVFSDGAIWRIG